MRTAWVGLDGEGVTLGEPHAYNDTQTVITGTHHKYISLSYRDATGRGDSYECREGLSTKDCLTFILSIPEDYKIAAYGFGYDLTKILEDLPPEALYSLTHPERRAYQVQGGRTNYRPVVWEGFALDLFNSRFKVGYAELYQTTSGRQSNYHGRGYRIVHDLSKFYQARFVTACKNWDVGTPEERNTMHAMKEDRRNLVKYTQEEILAYSNKECIWLADLAQKLDDACEEAEAPLKGMYFGAGSIAKSLMRKWGIKAQIAELPPEVSILARFAFFGGRFEISVRGEVNELVHDWDISSAYPYQIYMLPCLKCGSWSKTNDLDRVKASRCALVHYTLRKWQGALPPWGPYPFRDADGSIPFPVESGGGWLHKDEFLAGQALFPNVKFLGAWVYESNCQHRPFEPIANVYLERLRIGKEGPGIVLKLGANAVAGSVMQTIGTRPYHCPIWAGMITSGTRAQLLRMLGSHEKWSDVIMMATDGLWATGKKVSAPLPQETGTDLDVFETKSGKKTRKPLGGWEYGKFPQGVFMARPGIYFPLDLENIGDEENEKADDKIKDLKARGIGIRTLYRHRERIRAHYRECQGTKPYIIGDDDPLETVRQKATPEGVERFVGLKSGLVRTAKEENGRLIERIRRRDVYGLWTLQKRKIDFKARPKREEGNGRELEVRRLPLNQKSLTYERMASLVSIEEQLTGVTELGFFDDEQDDYVD